MHHRTEYTCPCSLGKVYPNATLPCSDRTSRVSTHCRRCICRLRGYPRGPSLPISDGNLNGSFLCVNVDHQTILPLPDDEVRKWCCRRQRYVSRINDAISYRTRELSACARLEHATVGKAEMAWRPTRRRWRRACTWRQREQPIRRLAAHSFSPSNRRAADLHVPIN